MVHGSQNIDIWIHLKTVWLLWFHDLASSYPTWAVLWKCVYLHEFWVLMCGWGLMGHLKKYFSAIFRLCVWITPSSEWLTETTQCRLSERLRKVPPEVWENSQTFYLSGEIFQNLLIKTLKFPDNSLSKLLILFQ